ncbi:hypothetical protein ACIOG8_36635 [Streptomyces erythrochromogenes]|uniref:hypothetical protein n=1 Tax=Streptomyces erythrochromogenes TaxID=285574 RepID=UPI0037FA904E
MAVWGGMTERKCRSLLGRRPLVASWRRLLEAARSEHQRVVRSPTTRSSGAPRGDHPQPLHPAMPSRPATRDPRRRMCWRTEGAGTALSVVPDKLHGWRSTTRNAIP